MSDDIRAEQCPFCRGTIPANAVFCQHCGQSAMQVPVPAPGTIRHTPSAPSPVPNRRRSLAAFFAVLLAAIGGLYYWQGSGNPALPRTASTSGSTLGSQSRTVSPIVDAYQNAGLHLRSDFEVEQDTLLKLLPSPKATAVEQTIGPKALVHITTLRTTLNEMRQLGAPSGLEPAQRPWDRMVAQYSDALDAEHILFSDWPNHFDSEPMQRASASLKAADGFAAEWRRLVGLPQ